MICCRCRRESPPGKFCSVCGGLLNAVPLSGKMPEPLPPAQPQQSQKTNANTAYAALLAAGAVLILALIVILLALWI